MSDSQQDKIDKELPKIAQAISEGKLGSLHPMVPYFKLGTEQLSLDEHFQLAPMFSLKQPPRACYKVARQLGKCQTRDSYVRLANGRSIRADELRIGDEVTSVTPLFKATTGRISGIRDNGVQRVFKVYTRLGSSFCITANHRIRTLFDYKELHELEVGSRIASLCRHGLFKEQNRINIARIVVTAYLIGDGHTGLESGIALTGVDGPVMREFANICADWLGKAQIKKGTKVITERVSHKSPVREWLEADGLLNKLSNSKFIPAWVFNLSERDTALFLSRLWATDGHIGLSKSGYIEISYTTISMRLARDVRSLLIKFGIPASITRRVTGWNGKRCADAFVVRVETRRGLLLFNQKIKVPGKPCPPLPTVPENNNRDTLPIESAKIIRDALNQTRYNRGRSLHAHGMRVSVSYPPSLFKFAKFIEVLDDNGIEDAGIDLLKAAAFNDVRWDSIESIEDVGEQETIDIEVEAEHNYVLDGVISHNSVCVTVQKILRCGLLPGFHNLMVQPRHDQIERYDTTILRPLLRGFAYKEEILSRGDTMNIASKKLANGSMIFLDYAFLTADRIRGLSGLASVDLDEIADIDWEFVPIIEETMSASKLYGFSQFTGTPKTTDGSLGYAWERSSQAEWVIKCRACSKENIPSVDHQLLKMIGKTTCVCAFCDKPLDARPPWGRYVHAFPERRSIFAGYHVSQVIHPLHYLRKAKWMRLLDKQSNYGTTKFYNEVLGESRDSGSKLLTSQDIKNACNNLKSNLDECVAKRRAYEGVLLGVDWSGGGSMEVSWTVVTAVGFRPGSDVLDCIYAVRLPQGNTPEEEAAQVMHIARSLKAAVVAHDYGGAGHLRETLLRQAGYPTERIAPFTYVASAKDVVTFNKPAGGSRSSYSLDKARSLAILCAMIRGGKVTLPRWSPAEPAENVLIGDLLNLSEQPKDLPRGGMMYTISKRPGTSDDFAHALNYACTAIWHIRQCYPNIAEAERFRAPVGEIELADPASMIWAVNKQKPR